MSPSQASDQNGNGRLLPARQPDQEEEFVRLPGFLRRWELSQVVQPTAEYRVEPAGETRDGTPLFAVYRRERAEADDADVGVPVTVTFESGQPVRARLMALHDDDPLFAVIIISGDPEDPGMQARVRALLSRMPAPPSTAPSLPTSPAHAAMESSPCSREA